MDPSRNLCLITNSFESIPVIVPLKSYSANMVGSPRVIRNKLKTSQNTENVYKPYTKLSTNYVTDPYRSMKTKFPERSSMVLANIDAVFNLTDQVAGYLAPQNTKEYDWGILGENDLGYEEYLQYRLPFSHGFISCQEIDEKRLDRPSLDLISGDDQEYIRYVNSLIPDGLDLLISDKNYRISIETALKCLKTGGNFVLKMDETNLLLSYIYLVALNFEKITIFKPITLNISSLDVYLVAENYTNKPMQWMEYIEDDRKIKTPPNLRTYLENYLISLNDMKRGLEIVMKSTNNLYNIYKCKNLWNMI